MAGLSADPANFFKFLLIIVLYTLVMTLWVIFPHLYPVVVTDSPSPLAELLVGHRI